ncbi:hypothetical protein EDD15DRAFT_2523178 [Pisolithus albus]|nr:hypothetical protein EDD15DRAFT_2523178 [Pisolithus albus]
MTSSNVRSVFGVLVGDFKRSANALGVSSRSCYLWREILEEHGSVNQPPSLLAGRAQTVTRALLTVHALALSASSFGDASLSCSGYSDYLREYILQRSTGYVYALSQWNSHNLHIQQAVDVQCAGPPTSRVPFSTVKLAVGSTAHVFKDIIILRAFGDYIFLVLDGPASRQTTTPLDQRDWVTRYISQRSSMEDRFADVRMAWSFSVSQTASYPSLSISSPDDIPDAGHSFEQNMEYLTNECRAAQFKNRGDTTYLVPDTASNKIWNNLRTARRQGNSTNITWGDMGVTWANTVTSECAGESNE